jgi:hypothetical protein
MAVTVSSCLAEVQATRSLAANLSQMHGGFQEDSLFQLAAVKGRRTESLLARFGGTTGCRLVLGARLASIGFSLPGARVDSLPAHFFQSDSAALRAEASPALEGSVVVVNNNDVGDGEGLSMFGEWVERCPHTLFLVWDWDNHHWLGLSQALAAHADMYFPTHNENMYFLSRLNWNIAGPVPCGTIQWTRDYLTRGLPYMLQAQRSAEPLGMHFHYAQFPFRNQSVVTLRQHFSGVGFSNPEFHRRTEEERFQEWCDHKSHWIIPVLNDVPIRIFDALSTGGIPIVPASLRYLWPVSCIPQEWIVFYEPQELLNPARVAERANVAFDRGGPQGIVARHRFALENHHGENSLGNLLAMAANRFGFQFGG